MVGRELQRIFLGQWSNSPQLRHRAMPAGVRKPPISSLCGRAGSADLDRMRNSMLLSALLLFQLACGGAAPPAEAPTDEQPVPVAPADPTKDVSPPGELPESPTGSSTPDGFKPRTDTQAEELVSR